MNHHPPPTTMNHHPPPLTTINYHHKPPLTTMNHHEPPPFTTTHHHQDEVVRFYCEPCQTCVCVLCTFNEHRDHAISQFQDVAVKYKANIEDLLASCKTKIQVLETQLESVNALVTCCLLSLLLLLFVVFLFVVFLFVA